MKSKSDLENAVGHANLGNALYDQDRFDEAVVEFQAAIRLNPEDASAHRRLGDALDDLGRSEEAIAEYRTSIQLDPTDSMAHNRGNCIILKLGYNRR